MRKLEQPFIQDCIHATAMTISLTIRDTDNRRKITSGVWSVDDITQSIGLSWEVVLT